MKNKISDYELDEKLKAYMRSGGEQAFKLDEGGVFKKKRTTYIAAVILIISLIAAPRVSAAITGLFTFIPGVGIVEKSGSAVYSMNPITRKSEDSINPKIYAYLENAIYSNGYLSISITIDGKFIDIKNFTLYINGISEDYQKMSWSASGSGFYMGHDIWLQTQEPRQDDVYEIEIKGFSERIKFTLDACADYETFAEIGPTDVKNGISLTALANKSGNELVVWCYPFNTTSDKLTAIGNAFPSFWNEEAYIETESGLKNIYNASGKRIMERFIFEMPESEASAVLHIPYLTLIRDEGKKLTVPVPKSYMSLSSDISISFSLGTVKITEIERKPAANNDKGKDILHIAFTFESADNNAVFSSFIAKDTKGTPMSHMSSYNEQTGCLEYIEMDVDKNASKIVFTISDLCYYLLGEYIIPLEINF